MLKLLFFSLLLQPLFSQATSDFDVNQQIWPWDQIDTTHTSFPKGFSWGAATASYQVEGNCENNWSYCDEQLKQINPDHIPADIACDHWHTYKDDIRLLKEAGLDTFRFSCAWEKIEPQEGIFNQEALDHYVDVCKTCLEHGIKPVVTLYHYTEPIWFYNKGGFEREENITYFVRYCQKLFEHLHPYVHLWFTFNAPSGVAYKGWLKGMMPPFKKNMQQAVEVLYNVLESHVQIYQAFKSMPGGNDAKIGFLKNIMQVDPLQPYNPLDILAAHMAYTLADKCIYEFFRTGKFEVWIPTKAYIKRENKAAPHSLDFIGLNYYTHTYIHNFAMGAKPEEIKLDNGRNVLYGEGLYRAIKSLSENIAKPLNIPIYVTENGASTSNMDHRKLFFERYLFALSKAIEDGYDVRGYINWALMDNYSWGTYHRKYGIYAVDFESPELTRTLKQDPGTQYLLSAVNKTT